MCQYLSVSLFEYIRWSNPHFDQYYEPALRGRHTITYNNNNIQQQLLLQLQLQLRLQDFSLNFDNKEIPIQILYYTILIPYYYYTNTILNGKVPLWLYSHQWKGRVSLSLSPSPPQHPLPHRHQLIFIRHGVERPHPGGGPDDGAHVLDQVGIHILLQG